MYWPGLDPGIFGVVGDFPHVSASCCCIIGAIFLYTIALGQLHLCTGNADFCMLANPLGSHTRSAEGQYFVRLCSLAGTRTRVGTIDPSQTPHS